MFRFILPLFLLSLGAAEQRLYMSFPISTPSQSTSQQASIVPLGCVLFGIMCPAGYTGPGSKPTSGGATVPTNAQQQRNDALANGNSYRAQHGAPPMTVDPTLQAEAQAYAEQLANSRTFQHSNAQGQYGENLARLPSPGTIAQANDAWYGEKPQYCPPAGTQTWSLQNGHFTQMVWKDSTQVGYGIATGSDGNTYIVARYKNPGNVQTQFPANVQC